MVTLLFALSGAAVKSEMVRAAGSNPFGLFRVRARKVTQPAPTFADLRDALLKARRV
jgi:hypothetical protein